MPTDTSSATAAQREKARDLVDEHGATYAERAGITLRDKPAPLFQLLVLTQLASVRISADIAVAAAREVFRAGWRTPQRLLDSTWQQRVDVLGRAHYRRYDESTATRLEELARMVVDDHRGDLRGLRPRGQGDGVERLRADVASFPRIGPTGAGIFCREVQAVWPEVRPYFDDRALRGAKARHLPVTAKRLAALVDPPDVVRLAAALAGVA